jgi:hypothetical protein
MNFSEIERGIKKGVLFSECGYGMALLMRAINDPEISKSESGRQIKWKAKNEKTGEVVNYLVTEGLEHYGPDIDIVGEAKKED